MFPAAFSHVILPTCFDGLEVHSWPDGELVRSASGQLRSTLKAMQQAVSPELFSWPAPTMTGVSFLWMIQQSGISLGIRKRLSELPPRMRTKIRSAGHHQVH